MYLLPSEIDQVGQLDFVVLFNRLIETPMPGELRERELGFFEKENLCRKDQGHDCGEHER